MNPRIGRQKRKTGYDRLNILMAVVFLFVAALLGKLFHLQLFQYDHYAALAAAQHRVNERLEPERGRIFIQDDRVQDGEKLYPLAANKDFALVYAVPDKVEKPREAAEALFDILDRPAIEAQVDEMIDNDDFFREIWNAEAIIEAGRQQTLEEFREIKRELEIKTRSESIIEKYYARLSKKGDPYEPLAAKVDEAKLALIKEHQFAGVFYSPEKHRFYPEESIGGHIVGFVGFGSEGSQGMYGLEGFFDRELRGYHGAMVAERAAAGGIIIVNDRQYNAPVNGSDLVLSLNRSVQHTACRMLREAVGGHGAELGTVIIMDPASGAIMAMCSYPDYDPNNYRDVTDSSIYNNPAIFNAYEPGSIFKAVTIAAGLDKGVITPSTTYEDKGFVMVSGWPKPIRNSDYETFGGHGFSTMTEVMTLSLNTGTIFVQQKLGAETFADYVRRFGFGEKTGIELETEGVSNISNLNRRVIRPIEAATASFGQGVTVTPLQMTGAFAAIANGGILMQPYIVRQIVLPDGSRINTQPQQIRRVISEKTALLTSGILVKVVEEGHAKLAAVPGYYVAGKTGTAQVADGYGGYSRNRTIHTFVGFGPVEEAKFVILVKLENVKDVRFSASSAAPLFSRIAEFMFNYYQIPKER